MGTLHVPREEPDIIGPIAEMGERIECPNDILREHCKNMDRRRLDKLQNSLGQSRLGGQPFSQEYQYVAHTRSQVIEWQVEVDIFNGRIPDHQPITFVEGATARIPSPAPAVPHRSALLRLFSPQEQTSQIGRAHV